ncbi:hypothetical protein CHS0354_038648 [Potamilus streckersoni]|uniref:Uncharacterized protein n=1 Tax=Potamilus streckersoni TaxID=2493646 RepID=A0AAE0T7L0_9BIVA|nr:hypothetical protein CHS0354_038648 [Potamilus streckersoni]
MHQQGENIRTKIDGEMLKGISKIQNRPLPVPTTTCRRPYRPIFANHKRKSRSLHNLFDTAHDAFYPLTGGLSLQLLHSHSIIMSRNRVNGTRDNDSIKKRRFSDCEDNQLNNISDDEDGFKLEFMYAKDRKEQDKKTDGDKHNASTNSESLINLRHDVFEQDPQENLYSTINEDALSVYDKESTSEI